MPKKQLSQTTPGPHNFEPSPEAYWRAATRRYETAVYLLENSSHWTDAIYLGGYAVECALKALILRRTARGKLDAVLDDIVKGNKAHNFDSLTNNLRAKDVIIPKNVRKILFVLGDQWSTDLRYSGHLTHEKTAREFLNQVEFVLEWARRSL